MYQVIETTRTFKVDGSLKSETTRTVFSSADPVECLRWRYAKADGGHSVSFIRDVSVTLNTHLDGKPFGFADLFLLVEGQAAYDAVMNDEAPAQNEAAWLAAHDATPTPAAPAVKLTAKQAEVMHHYSDRVGETFDVLCGYLTNAVNPEFRPVGPPTTIATLRGLETKGLIRIVDSFWKGATITVLKAA